MKTSNNNITDYAVIDGEVFDVSEVKTLYKKVDGKETTEVSGFSQEVVIWCAGETDEFGKVQRRAQFYPIRVWANKSYADIIMPIGLIGEVKCKVLIDGTRFTKKEPKPGERETSFFLSLNMSAWKLVKEKNKRPVVDQKISEGTTGTDDLPF
jgi:hypothetical protein